MAPHTPPRDTKVPYLEYPSPNQQHHEQQTRRQCLIYLIPGNPGLAGYYDPFLATLRQLLDETEAKNSETAFHLSAQNLLGFCDNDHEPPFGTDGTTPFNLEDQICHVYDRLVELNSPQAPHSDSEAPVYDEVIVIGHSVGSYIAVEVFHRHHLRMAATDINESNTRHLNLKAGILLFPTVSHMAKSSSGKKLDLIRRVPFLDNNAHRIAKSFVDLWPRWFLDVIVGRVMGFPAHAAAATVEFLVSRDGIWQALHLGKDEMVNITEEKWGEELWEIASDAEEDEAAARRGDGDEDSDKELKSAGRTKFFFYYAKKDHWVADECRDAFIERRSTHGRGGTRIMIDEHDIPHAFCIAHSELVAEKVKGWVDEIMGA
ncbi:hypothetical protein B0T19DRAFT_424928 [Cercophora scortea]|uniref:Lipid droplet-associated hydrolase n=1 Tax=Cercophora scortea TaxID=314031 RepID=A0AAE0IP47_9PEZI|nr:hypothetical protein B0T19DRAFT_424928 [Cercophora scortea]